MKRDTIEKREEEREERETYYEKRQRVEKCLKTSKLRQTNCLIMIRKKKTVWRNIRSKVQNLTRVFNYVHDSNSIFRPARINSEIISGGTVLYYQKS